MDIQSRYISIRFESSAFRSGRIRFCVGCSHCCAPISRRRTSDGRNQRHTLATFKSGRPSSSHGVRDIVSGHESNINEEEVVVLDKLKTEGEFDACR